MPSLVAYVKGLNAYKLAYVIGLNAYTSVCERASGSSNGSTNNKTAQN